jgi:hypothetical protein
VAPLQGLRSVGLFTQGVAPRLRRVALPWAIMSCPLRGGGLGSVAETLVLLGLLMRDPFGESHRRTIRWRLVAPDDAAGDDGGAGDSAGEPGNGLS